MYWEQYWRHYGCTTVFCFTTHQHAGNPRLFPNKTRINVTKSVDVKTRNVGLHISVFLCCHVFFIVTKLNVSYLFLFRYCAKYLLPPLCVIVNCLQTQCFAFNGQRGTNSSKHLEGTGNMISLLAQIVLSPEASIIHELSV